MIIGTKYINNAIFYTLFKKHYCPDCNKRLRLVKKSKIVNYKSLLPELVDRAQKGDFDRMRICPLNDN